VRSTEQLGLGAFAEVEVMGDDALVEYVVRVEQDVAGFGDADGGRATGWEAAELGPRCGSTRPAPPG
jgi:hypothetical protein